MSWDDESPRNSIRLELGFRIYGSTEKDRTNNLAHSNTVIQFSSKKSNRTMESHSQILTQQYNNVLRWWYTGVILHDAGVGIML